MRGWYGRGGSMPYIYHPMEVALLVSRMTQDAEVIAAAYLHDVLEDTPVTAEELGQIFGKQGIGIGAGRDRGQVADLEGAEGSDDPASGACILGGKVFDPGGQAEQYTCYGPGLYGNGR